METMNDKGPILAQGATELPPLPDFFVERGDVQIRTDDEKWGLQLQRREEGVYLAIGSIGPVAGHPEGVGSYVLLVPKGLEYMYRWLTREARAMRREGVL